MKNTWLDIEEVNMLKKYNAVKKKAYCKYCLSTTGCCDDIEAETCQAYLDLNQKELKKSTVKGIMPDNNDIKTKLTAVEWLVEELKDNGIDYDISESVEQAKEIERQQIIDAYHINPKETKWGNIGVQYYNETFKKNNQE